MLPRNEPCDEIKIEAYNWENILEFYIQYVPREVVQNLYYKNYPHIPPNQYHILLIYYDLIFFVWPI